MRHVRSLIEDFGHSQIPDLNAVVFVQKHVDRFYVSVKYFVVVQVKDPKAHFNEVLPDDFLVEGSAHLFLYVHAQVSILAELHDDVDLFILHKRIVHLHDVLKVELLHQNRFLF